MIPEFLEILTAADYENKNINNYYYGQYKNPKYS